MTSPAAIPSPEDRGPGPLFWPPTQRILYILIFLLLAARFLFLAADFPNFSWWIDDAARYTDEGWYAAGAVNHVLFGHWLLPGDFNAAVALPLWPLMLSAVFHFTGVSIVAMRTLEAVCSCLAVVLAGRLYARYEPRGALWFTLLLAASPIFFFFGRLAILEEPMLVFALAAMLVASRLGQRSVAAAVATGLLLLVAFLIKTTALFLLPVILYQIWFAHRRQRGIFLLLAGTVCVVLALGYAADWLLLLHPYAADYRAFMGENRPSISMHSVEKAVRILYRGYTWMDHLLFPLACLAVLLSVTRLRRMWRDPLTGIALLWLVGYSAFMVLHVDAGPRYFVVLVPPMLMLCFVLARTVAADGLRWLRPIVAVMAVALLWNVSYIGWLLLRPQYTLLMAARNIRTVIDSHPSVPKMIVGHGAVEITLWNRVPAFNEFGSAPLGEKLDRYHPGWLLLWNDVLDLAKLPAFVSRYNVVPAGSFPALDQHGRDRLVLYRLEPRTH